LDYRRIGLGVGGLGSCVANILCRLPFKKIVLIDGDTITKCNFERQFLFFPEDLEKSKAKVAFDRLKKFSNVDYYDNFIGEDNLDVLSGSNLIMDCSDNFKVRELIYYFCKKNNVPWIHSAVIQNKGNVLFVHPSNDSILKLIIGKAEKSCREFGVINANVSLVASLASSIAINYCAKGIWEEKLIRIDLDKNEIKKIKV